MIRIVIPYVTHYNAVRSGLRGLKAHGFTFALRTVQSPYVHTSRNRGVNEAKCGKIYQEPYGSFSHYLFVDPTVTFEPSDVYSALAMEKDIVTLPCIDPKNRNLYEVGEMRSTKRRMGEHRYTVKEKGKRRVSWTAPRFLLVKRHVFCRMRYPWFRLKPSGERAFCLCAEEAEAEIWCNFDRPVTRKETKRSK